MLADEIASRIGKRHFVILSADDHDSHFFSREISKALSNREMGARFHYEFHHGNPETETLARRVIDAEAFAVIVAADVDDSARLVVALRDHGFRGAVFGRSVLDVGLDAISVVCSMAGGSGAGSESTSSWVSLLPVADSGESAGLAMTTLGDVSVGSGASDTLAGG